MSNQIQSSNGTFQMEWYTIILSCSWNEKNGKMSVSSECFSQQTNEKVHLHSGSDVHMKARPGQSKSSRGVLLSLAEQAAREGSYQEKIPDLPLYFPMEAQLSFSTADDK